MKIDKQNGTVAFNDQEHVYWNVNDNKRYVSVTTLIHRYTQEFDKEFELRDLQDKFPGVKDYVFYNHLYNELNLKVMI